MKYYIIAGEASGDLHGGNFLKALYAIEPEADVRGWGGDKMKEAGATIVKHYRDLAFMGFVEVLKNIGTILKNFRACKSDILEFQPDKVILVDYPGFNLRMAKWLKKNGFTVYYYISPQIWAWHQSRVHQIIKHVDRMFVILPFEKDFYAKYGMEVEFVGHPLLDVTEHFESEIELHQAYSLPEKEIIALLPGSRKQEIELVLPEMVQVVKHFPNYQFVIGGVSTHSDAWYRSILAKANLSEGQVPIVKGHTYELLAQAKAALVTSGTATLETALFEVPQVVCYKGSRLSYMIAKSVVKVDYISLVNLVANKPIVKELVQRALNEDNLKRELAQVLDNALEMQEAYRALKQKLGNEGASQRLASLVVEESAN